MKKGILYGVSTGPGDPELITLKSIRCIEKVQVLAAPRTKGKNSIALDIIKGIMDISDKEICYLDFTMDKNVNDNKSVHDINTQCIEKYLSSGIDVAMLNIGDASLFGTFGYIREIIEANGYQTVTIPGVPSFCAVAATLGQSLTSINRPLTVIPGSFEYIDEELNFPGTKVIMKPANRFADIKSIIEKKGLVDKSSMVVNCGFTNERIYRDIRQSSDNEGYFVTLLINDIDEVE